MKKMPTKKTKKNKLKIQDEDALNPELTASYNGAVYDTLLHATMGKFTNWISPASLGLAFYDWLAHLSMSPAKSFDLMQKIITYNTQFFLQFTSKFGKHPYQIVPYLHPSPKDNRFKYEGWQEFPFDLYQQAFLFCELWWNQATSNIKGVTTHHQHVVNFAARQMLDMFAPSNFPATNPEMVEFGN